MSCHFELNERAAPISGHSRRCNWAMIFALGGLTFTTAMSSTFAQTSPAQQNVGQEQAADEKPANEKPTASPDATALAAELDKFRDGLFHAFNSEKYQEMLDQNVHKDVIATWQDGTTSRGHAGVIAEFDKLKQFIDKMQVNPSTDQRLVLESGNLVVASGEMRDDYALARGRKVNLKSRWSATLVRDGERWVLVSFSASTNAFDNEVIDLYLLAAKYKAWGVAGVISLIVGLVIGAAVAKSRK